MDVDANLILWTVLVVFALAGVGMVLGSWLTGAAAVALERSGLDPSIRRLLVQTVRPVIMVIFAVAGATYVGVDLSPVTAMIAAATFAIGMALQGTLSNVASGAMLLTLRPFREGDTVIAAGQLGKVLEQGLFTVTVQTPDGITITAPNNSVFGGPIHNFTRHGRRRIEIALVLSFDADVDQALELMLAAATSDERVLDDPAPTAIIGEFNDRGVRVVLWSWVSIADFGAAKASLHRDVAAAVKAAKIPLAPPLIARG